jgi:nitrite reductase/ring-hydroxylating ferredoxin subunit
MEGGADLGFFKRIFGICDTKPPRDAGCWTSQPDHAAIDLKRAPELGEPGGAVRLEGQDLPNRILVIRGDDGNLHAFINKCTHAGRRIDPRPGTSTVRCCSVGKSTFNYSGEALSGWAKEPLTRLKAREEPGKLVISFVPDTQGTGKKLDTK